MHASPSMGHTRDMVSRFGMSEKLGTVAYGSDDEVFIGRDYEKTRAYSDKTAGEIDSEIKALIDRAYARCTEILEANRAKLEQVADFLLEHENMSREEFEKMMKDEC